MESGWHAYQNEAGETYYYDHDTGESQWDIPYDMGQCLVTHRNSSQWSATIDSEPVDQAVAEMSIETGAHDETRLQEISPLGFNVDILKHFVEECGGRDVISSRSIAYMCQYYVKRFTNSKKVTYCEEMRSEREWSSSVGPAVVLVCHSSECNFMAVVDLLLLHHARSGLFLWWDVFCSNFHLNADYSPDWFCGLFKTWVTESITQVALVLPAIDWMQADVSPLRRSWCLWEVFAGVSFCRPAEEDHSRAPRRVLEILANADAVEQLCDALLSDFTGVMTMWESFGILAADVSGVGHGTLIRSAIRDLGITFEQFDHVVHRSVIAWVIDRFIQLCEDSSFAQRRGKDQICDVMYTIGKLYQCQGNIGRAEEFFRLSVTQRQSLRSQAPPSVDKIVNTLHCLGRALSEQQKLEEALSVHRRAVKISSETYGMCHNLSICCLSDLGRVLKALGHVKEAETALREVVGSCRATYGDTHVDTLTAISNLALLLQAQNRSEESLRLFSELLMCRRNILGNTHPSALTSMSHLAVSLQAVGQMGDAEQLFRECLEGRRSQLGSSHLSTLCSLHQLATVLRLRGEYDESELLFREALQGKRRVLGPKHRMTLATMDALAAVLQDMCRLEEAEELVREVMLSYRAQLGPMHPTTADAAAKLGCNLQLQGKLAEGRPVLVEVLRVRRENFGNLHEDTIRAANELGRLVFAMKRFDEALPLFQEVLLWRRDKWGPVHAACGGTLRMVGLCFDLVGDTNRAESSLRECLRIRSEVLAVGHVDTVISMVELASLLYRLKRNPECEEMYGHARELSRKHLGVYHPAYLSVLSGLGKVFHRTGRLKEAEPLYRELRAARRKTEGECHASTVSATNSLAGLLRDQRRFDEALGLYQYVLDTRTKELGASHRLTLSSLCNLGTLQRDRGRMEEAESVLVDALQRCRDHLGSDDPDTVSTITLLAHVLRDNGKGHDAIVLLRESLAIRRHMHGMTHRDTINNMNDLALLLHRLGNTTAEAVELLECAWKGFVHLMGRDHPDTNAILANLEILRKIYLDNNCK